MTVPGFGPLNVQDIAINGGGLSLDVRGAITGVIVETKIMGADTVTISLSDPHRDILRSGLFKVGDLLALDGLNFVLVQFAKASDTLQLTFESQGTYALRQQKGAIATTATTDLAGFAAMLVAQVPGLKLVTETSPVLAAGFQTGRGTSADPTEDSWTCLVRLATTAGWRVWEHQNVVFLGSDPFFLGRVTPAPAIREFTAGVQLIDFTYDVGQPFGTATVTAMTELWQYSVGWPVPIAGCGPADGMWLIQDMQRDFYSPQTTLTFAQPMTPQQLLAQSSLANGTPAGTAPGITVTASPNPVPTGTPFRIACFVQGSAGGPIPQGTVEFAQVETGTPQDIGTSQGIASAVPLDANGYAVLSSDSTGFRYAVTHQIVCYFTPSDVNYVAADNSANPLIFQVT